MPAANAPNPIEQARLLIAAGRSADARKVLAPLHGIPAAAGPVQMLVAYSYLGEANVSEALAALRRIPARVEPALGLAVARMLMTCDSGGMAIDRLRPILAEVPSSSDAAAALAEAAALEGRPKAALVWAERAGVLGASSPGLTAARVQGLLDEDRCDEAAGLIAEAQRAGADVDAIVTATSTRLQNADSRIATLDRMMSALGTEILRRPKVATVAATAAYNTGAADRAAALLADAGWGGPAGIDLRHEIALERGDAATAAACVARARRRVVLNPGEPDPAIDLLAFWLRSTDHDSAEILRWTAHGACLAGPGLQPGPDRLFTECVRWKNDMSQRLNGRGGKIAHALGTLAAEEAFKGPVAVRNGASHAKISIAGKDLKLRLTSSQIRRTTSTFFAMEPGMLRWFAGFDPADVLVDVGANIGMYTVLAAGLSGCRVIAIEPFSLNVADLKHNVEANGLEHRVTVMHAAATDRERVDILYFGQTYAGAANQSFGRDDISEQYDDRDAGREEVHGYPLDVLVQRGEIPFPTHVKIDVDGLEEPVIEGMRGILSDPRFKSLRMEIRWLEASRQAFVNTILAQGFSVKVADDVKNLLFTRVPAG